MVNNSGKKLTRFSPLDNSEVATVSRTSVKEVDQILSRSREASQLWGSTPIETRGRVIRHAAQLLEANSEELANLVRRETGKPIAISRGEIAAAIEMGYLMASYGRHPSGVFLPSAVPGRHVRAQRVPRGVALLIVSFNTPFPNYAWKVFPALMAGNSAILKPSPATPASAEAFVKLLLQAGVPNDVLQIMHGDGALVAEVIGARVDLVSFTGSYRVGQEVAIAAAPTMTKLILELGGSNPLIVCADADLRGAVEALVDSAFSNAGQRCASASRVLVESSAYSGFRELLFERLESLSWGTHEDAIVSTLIDEQSAQDFETFLVEAEDQGAVVTRVGVPTDVSTRSSCLVQPALIENLGPDVELGLKEIFGPATRLFSFSGDDEAVAMANTSEYGLTAAVWSRNIVRAERIVTKLEAGVININGPTHGAELNMPFGGMKNSGNGTKDAGYNAIDEYSDTQVVSTFFGV